MNPWIHALQKISFFCLLFFLWITLWAAVLKCTHLPDYILPSPLQVGKAFIEQSGLLLSHAWPTFLETLGGLGGAFVLGSISALLMAHIKSVAIFLRPLFLISQAMPVLVLAPLLTVWLGYGVGPKIVTLMIMLYFPIASGFLDGLTHTPQAWLDLAFTLESKPWRTLWHIKVPAALPQLMSGVRVAAAWAPMGAVASEWAGASKGLGVLMITANARLQMDVLFAVIFILIFYSFMLYFSLDVIFNNTCRWIKHRG